MICKACNSQINENARFCGKCGIALDTEPVPEQQEHILSDISFTGHTGTELMNWLKKVLHDKGWVDIRIGNSVGDTYYATSFTKGNKESIRIVTSIGYTDDPSITYVDINGKETKFSKYNDIPMKQTSNSESRSTEQVTEDLLISTSSVCVKNWAFLFKDISDGDDMRKWSRIFNTHLSVLLGANRKHVGPSPALSKEEAVRFITPCFFDQDPVTYKQYNGTNQKIKFNSKFCEGFLLIVDNNIITIRDRNDIGAYEIHKNPLCELEFHEMKFAFSKLSMTSAGKGYEFIFPDHRVLFRLGLSWKDDFNERINFLNLIEKKE